MFPEHVMNQQKRIEEFLYSLGAEKNKIENHQLMLESFIHKSFAADYKDDFPDNERLEFLGDGILGAVVNKMLFLHHPHLSESEMTLYKIALVREETLADVARDIELGKMVFISKGEERSEGRDKDSILSDCLEAVIGYIYLDLGWEYTQEFIKRYIFCRFEEISKQSAKSHKTILQEVVQRKYKTIPEYRDSENKIDDKNNVLEYKSEIYILDQKEAEGLGTNKKKAQSDAAKKLLEKWGIN